MTGNTAPRNAGSGSGASVPQQSPPPQPTAPGETVEPQEAFAELGRLVVGETPLGEVLARVAELARACVPGAEEVSVPLLEDGEARSAAFSGKLAATLDERRYEAGSGPCLDAAQSGQTVRVDDTATTEVHPDFGAVAARQGVRSCLSVGMPMPQRILGGINVYRFDDGVLVANLRCSPEDAFAHLVKQSQHANRKLRDIATEIVERAGRG
ncbi:ANTAR domain-containing protein [Kineococcus sp. SYSU DK018]|uniref:ANTAR domain-containing protein n=1 Tax=Kineococcus sp. SYSU DK018 TaxID=3383139 RepID=UPI003D7EF4A1